MPTIVLGCLSLISLATCLLSSILYFLAQLSPRDFKLIFLLASVGWFFFAILWSKKTKARVSGH